jgi:hypothetical protein
MLTTASATPERANQIVNTKKSFFIETSLFGILGHHAELDVHRAASFIDSNRYGVIAETARACQWLS